MSNTVLQKNQRSSRMNVDKLLVISNVSLLSVTLLGVVLSGLIFYLTNLSDKQKDRELAAYKAKAQQEISQANKAAEEAKLKAAEATLQLERERAAREKLEGRLGPRRLSSDTKRELSLKVAEQFGLRVHVLYQPDQEVVGYTNDIIEAMRSGGAIVRAAPCRVLSIGAQYPLEVSVRTDGRGAAVCDTLAALGIDFHRKAHENRTPENGMPLVGDHSADLMITVNGKDPHLA
ncbi:type II secretory pathway pseudopilin PulG [Caulobacter sp. BE264]|uniref:hypothetical protein n=1 Tax=Caulobacter sp. BE264 TaxID=2817724 RepID=UPI002860DE98|nr:hypothetical protein [Caulobacter sp. BE264]MDR7230645.1 type II secretory pathway pseudopilin PulG [Caulobacter sp. BE264]